MPLPRPKGYGINPDGVWESCKMGRLKSQICETGLITTFASVFVCVHVYVSVYPQKLCNAAWKVETSRRQYINFLALLCSFVLSQAPYPIPMNWQRCKTSLFTTRVDFIPENSASFSLWWQSVTNPARRGANLTFHYSTLTGHQEEQFSRFW